MKQLKTLTSRIALIIVSFYVSLIAFAQEETKKIDININTKGAGSANNFFAQPWVWVVGGAVFILLLVALMRGNRSKGD